MRHTLRGMALTGKAETARMARRCVQQIILHVGLTRSAGPMTSVPLLFSCSCILCSAASASAASSRSLAGPFAGSCLEGLSSSQSTAHSSDTRARMAAVSACVLAAAPVLRREPLSLPADFGRRLSLQHAAKELTYVSAVASPCCRGRGACQSLMEQMRRGKGATVQREVADLPPRWPAQAC